MPSHNVVVCSSSKAGLVTITTGIACQIPLLYACYVGTSVAAPGNFFKVFITKLKYNNITKKKFQGVHKLFEGVHNFYLRVFIILFKERTSI